MTTPPLVLDSRGERLEVGGRVDSRYGRAEVTDIEVYPLNTELRIETLASRRGVRFRAYDGRIDHLTRIPEEEGSE